MIGSKKKYLSTLRFGFLLLAFPFLSDADDEIDFLKNPPVTCTEEAIPSFPDDHVVNEPFGFHQEVAEVLARTGHRLKLNDPNFADDWRLLNSARDAKTKVDMIDAVSDLYDMPPQILTGALLQESSMADYGLNEDYGNWSCGIGQINVLEWCDWAMHADAKTQAELKWPTLLAKKVTAENPDLDVCSGFFLRSSFAKPFYAIGMKRLRADGVPRPDFLLKNETFSTPRSIKYYETWNSINEITHQKTHCPHKYRYNDECLKISSTRNEGEAEELRFSITRNFVEHCADFHYGIPAKGYALKSIFDQLPDEIKQSQHYTHQEAYPRKCLKTPVSKAYPLHVGWLLADVIYNAGDEILPGIIAYQNEHELKWDSLTPQELINGVHYALHKRIYNKHLTKIGQCEAHFHIQNVIHNITLPGSTIVPIHPEINCEDLGNQKRSDFNFEEDAD